MKHKRIGGFRFNFLNRWGLWSVLDDMDEPKDIIWFSCATYVGKTMINTFFIFFNFQIGILFLRHVR